MITPLLFLPVTSTQECTDIVDGEGIIDKPENDLTHNIQSPDMEECYKTPPTDDLSEEVNEDVNVDQPLYNEAGEDLYTSEPESKVPDTTQEDGSPSSDNGTVESIF